MYLNKRITYLFFVTFCFSCILVCQVNTNRYEKHFYHNNGSPQSLSKIISTNDTGVCIAVNLLKQSNIYNIEITKLNKYGNLQWSYTYSVDQDSVMNFSDIIYCKDKGFIIVGNSLKNYSTPFSSQAPFIFKVDSAGSPLWAKKYNYKPGAVYSIKELKDSSIAIGFNYSTGSIQNFIFQKLTKYGIVLWSKKVPRIYGIIEKINKNLQVFSGGSSIYVEEFDNNGISQWERYYKNSHYYFNAWKIDINEKNETLIISDLMDSTGTNNHSLYLMKINNFGTPIFANKYKGDWLYNQTYAGGFTQECNIIINTRLRYNPANEIQGILKTDNFGNVKWLKTFPTNHFVWSESVTNTTDFGYASLGSGDYGNILGVHSRLIKTDINGSTSCHVDSSIAVNTNSIAIVIDSSQTSNLLILINNYSVAITQKPNFLTILNICSDSIFIDSLKVCNSLSNEVPHEELTEIKIPNVFTPNTDNVNDLFKIDITNFNLFNINILNRWGTTVFQSNNPSVSWNGKINNYQENEVNGTYYYIIKVVDKSNNEKTYKGFLTLIR